MHTHTSFLFICIMSKMHHKYKQHKKTTLAVLQKTNDNTECNSNTVVFAVKNKRTTFPGSSIILFSPIEPQNHPGRAIRIINIATPGHVTPEMS